MNKEIVKKAFDSAEKEVENKQIEDLKKVIKRTLERIDEVDKLIKELQEEKKILKLDIEDLKEGRLDRIEERQKQDKKAQETSVVKVEKVVEKHYYHYDRWYEPYKITWVYPQPHYDNEVFCLGNTLSISASDCSNNMSLTTKGDAWTDSTVNTSFTLTNSVAHNNVIGTYSIGDKTVHLR